MGPLYGFPRIDTGFAMSQVRNELNVARRATVRIYNDASDEVQYVGQGLLLGNLDGRGHAVLTCYHFIKPLIERGSTFISIEVRDCEPNNQLETLREPAQCIAWYDPDRSKPGLDAAVLRIDPQDLRLPFAYEFPRLHTLSMKDYKGTSRLPVQMLTHHPRICSSFPATLSSIERLGPEELRELQREVWAFQLSDATFVDYGISGSVAFCEDGVLGLVHFARKQSARADRTAYLLPLDIWGDGWNELQRRFEPLIDSNLRAQVQVFKPVSELDAVKDFEIDTLLENVYISRETPEKVVRDVLNTEVQDDQGEMRKQGRVLLVGRPLSGKTRMVWQLLKEYPDAFVMIPKQGTRLSHHFEIAGLSSLPANRPLILVFDGLDLTTDSSRPLEWHNYLKDHVKSCLLICTAQDGLAWKRLYAHQFRVVEQVFISGDGHLGKDMTLNEARGLAAQLDQQDNLSERFDGTPGSLISELTGMHDRYQRLCEERFAEGVNKSALLHAAKALRIAGEPQDQEQLLPDSGQLWYHDDLLRAVANEDYNGGISDQTWGELKTITRIEGFGSFDELGDFRTYPVYLEKCVKYTPSGDKLGRSLHLLLRREDVRDLDSFGLTVIGDQPDLARQAFKKVIELGDKRGYIGLGRAHVQLRQEMRAKEAYYNALRAGITEGNYSMAVLLGSQDWEQQRYAEGYYLASLNLGNIDAAYPLGQLVLKLQAQGRERDAEYAFERAWKEGDNAEAAYELGRILARRRGREVEAMKAFRSARKAGKVDAIYELGKLLTRQSRRQRSAERVLRNAWEKAGNIEATYELGKLLARQSDRKVEAEMILRVARKAGNMNAVNAMYDLGKLLMLWWTPLSRHDFGARS